jgi:hypothetical protein
MLGVLGSVASYIAIVLMRTMKSGDPAAALRKVTLLTAAIFLAMAFAYFFFYSS